MRRFIVEVVIDTVLLAVILLILGAVSVSQPFPFGTGSAQIVALRGAGLVGFASWAAVLVLVNRFARPVLVALTGRLLFSTMGLFVVIINAIAIWLTSVLAPIKIGIVADPTWLWIIVGGRAVHRPVHGRRCGPRPEPAGPRGRPKPRDVGLPRTPADATSQLDHREPAPPAGLQRDLHDRSRHRPGRDARRPAPELVRPRRPGRDGRLRWMPAGPRGSGRCSSSSARPT